MRPYYALLAPPWQLGSTCCCRRRRSSLTACILRRVSSRRCSRRCRPISFWSRRCCLYARCRASSVCRRCDMTDRVASTTRVLGNSLVSGPMSAPHPKAPSFASASFFLHVRKWLSLSSCGRSQVMRFRDPRRRAGDDRIPVFSPRDCSDDLEVRRWSGAAGSKPDGAGGRGTTPTDPALPLRLLLHRPWSASPPVPVLIAGSMCGMEVE
mmetsp:Transcript_9800/g.25157  ORF Transcript_9800/g.25157 Transcript_9800/m.25157 type:complete len:210 (-) Transcript_9800:113-742(-)